MMAYVDGFLIPVAESNRAQYAEMAKVGAEVFIAHGATHVSENWGDDLIKGQNTDFYMAVKAEEGENVVFSWISWPSKEARDAGNKAAMDDPRFAEFFGQEIFDGKRMIFSGFQNIVDKRA
jgi:uncharacterized protein YbaA (DUF1428 family)